MTPLQLLNEYLNRLESRFRLAALARGGALVAGAALGATLFMVLFTNWYAFSERSLSGGRIVLFLCVSLALGFGLVLPLLRLNRRRVARATEEKLRQFDQRLLTLAEREATPDQKPFLELLAAETLDLARDAEPDRVIGRPLLLGFFSAAVAAAGVLLWLILGATGYLGYGSRLLWAGTPRGGETRAFYDIVISPGDRSVRRGSSHAVTARLVGFQAASVRLFAKYRDSAKWEEAPMVPQPGSATYEFLFAGVPETVDYYAVAGKLRSKTYTLSVVDVPVVKRLRVTYRYPAWTGLVTEIEDPGGDLRAVEGTEAEIAVETDRPLGRGVLVLEDGSQVSLDGASGKLRSARVKIQKDGSYHVAALEQGELVRLTDDYFIQVQKDNEPLVRIRRPGRDAKVSPIEEVTVELDASDDFGLKDVTLHYSVNGGPEKTVSMFRQKSGREAEGSTVLYLEDYKLAPGDVVSLYATARDARTSSRTDMFFIEAQPFEREYTQSQQMSGGGMQGGQGEQEGRISQRQKEIISATWNQVRDRTRDKQAAADNARFLSDMQAKLRDQAQSLSKRMDRRELSAQSQELQSFSSEMEQAARDMGKAAEMLKSLKWQEALAPEQQALQHVLRAEATYRQIQVAFGNRGGQGGGGGGGAQRDLENLFDLELDTEKNQYESGQQASAGGNQRSREMDEALQRLEQLARRQQELADRARRQPQQSSQQRWQQEMLRREAEELQQRMQQMAKSGGSSQSGQSQSQGDARLDQALRRLGEATEDMRRAGSQQGQAESRRAAERLQEAQNLMRGMRSEQAGQQLDDMTRRAERLADQQREFQERLRQAFPSPAKPGQAPPAQPGELEKQRQQAQQLAKERDKMLEEFNRLEGRMQQTARDLAGSQRETSSRLRGALGQMQQNEISTRMRYSAELLRRGYGRYVPPREGPVTQGLNQLRDQLREAQGALDRGGAGRGGQEQALGQLERLRGRLQGLARGSGGEAANRGDRRPEAMASEFRSGAGSDTTRLYQESLRDLTALRQSLEGNPEAARDIQDVLAELRKLDPSRFPGNPELLERLRTQVLPALEQLEVQLRRQADDQQSGQVRDAGAEPAPPGYSSAVAEYFRRLSKGK